MVSDELRIEFSLFSMDAFKHDIEVIAGPQNKRDRVSVLVPALARP
jgi:hypothetical protein